MDIVALSQINFGLIIKGIKSASMYDADDFFPPYDEGIEYLKKHPKSGVEDCMKVMSPSAYQDAMDAGISMNGMGEKTDFVSMLRHAAQAYKLGKMYKKVGEKLEKNQDIDLLEVNGKTQALMTSKMSGGLTRLADMDYGKFEPFQKSGWDAIDNIFGGIPKSGLMLVMGETAVGKSFFLAKLLQNYMGEHKKDTAAVYTLEMPGEEWANRSVKMYPDLFKHRDRFYISGMARTVDEIVAEVSNKRLNIIGIDFVDWLATENSEGAYSYVYKRCVELARMLGIVVVLLAQPNRDGVKYKKFLTKYDARWTGMSENSAWQFIGLQETNSLDIDDNKYPSFDENHQYLINLKQRGGWPKQQGPGAIILEPHKTKWEGAAMKNKLWLPGDYSSGQAIKSRQTYGKDTGSRKYER